MKKIKQVRFKDLKRMNVFCRTYYPYKPFIVTEKTETDIYYVPYPDIPEGGSGVSQKEFDKVDHLLISESAYSGNIQEIIETL